MASQRGGERSVRLPLSLAIAGPSGAGKTYLFERLAQAGPGIATVTRITTRGSRLAESSIETRAVTVEEFAHLATEGLLFYAWRKLRPDGVESNYGFMQPPAAAVLVFPGNDALLTHQAWDSFSATASNALSVRILASDDVRQRRILSRSPELLDDPSELDFRLRAADEHALHVDLLLRNDDDDRKAEEALIRAVQWLAGGHPVEP